MKHNERTAKSDSKKVSKAAERKLITINSQYQDIRELTNQKFSKN